MGEADERSLYQEIGGAAGVEDVVAGLYQRTMADETLAPFFADRAIEVIVAHQRELIAGALGGPAAYAGRSLRDAHAGMAIEPEHVHALTTHLVDALSACGVAPSATDRVAAVITRLWYAKQWPREATDDPPAPS